MQIEAWLVVGTSYEYDTVIAAFDNSDDAWRLKEQLDELPEDQQKQIIRDAWMRLGEAPSELISFRVWHLFKHPIVQPSANRVRRVPGPQ